MALNLVADFCGRTIAIGISKSMPRKGSFDPSSQFPKIVYTLVNISNFPLEILPHRITS